MEDIMAPFDKAEHDLYHSSMSSYSLSDSQFFYNHHLDNEAKLSPHQESIKFSSARKRRKKSVSFAKNAMLHLIPGIDSYSQDELEAMYLTEEDNERIREENDRTIEELLNGELPDTESLCFRGLECAGISHRCNQKRAMREITISLIISEQEQGEDICSDWIENVYSKITEDSVTLAEHVASLDAQSVKSETTAATTTSKSKLYIDWIQNSDVIRQ